MAKSESLFERVHSELCKVKIIDTHEHLQRDSELPKGKDIHLGRFFIHYASCDLVSAGMSPADMARVQSSAMSDEARWKLLKPWYEKAWNTGYCEALRVAARDLYGVEDLRDDTMAGLLTAMREKVKPGWTRKVFDAAGIDFALTNPFGPKAVYNPDMIPECFIVDMTDQFTGFPVQQLAKESDIEILCLDDYLKVIDWYFEHYAATASAFKVGRAYDRTLYWADVTKGEVDGTFNRLLAFNDRPDRRDIQALEDFVMHYLVRKCGEHNLMMKFHTGIQEGNGNFIANSRAALMSNLFMKYPNTRFDLYHISYPYQEELAVVAKNFRNVFVDFCWMWIINPAAARRALSDMLDAVPANKIHGFGGDFIFVEGSYGHCVIARREISRVLCEKVEEGRFAEDYAVRVGRMLLRENAIENFGLAQRRRRAIPVQKKACATA